MNVTEIKGYDKGKKALKEFGDSSNEYDMMERMYIVAAKLGLTIEGIPTSIQEDVAHLYGPIDELCDQQPQLTSEEVGKGTLQVQNNTEEKRLTGNHIDAALKSIDQQRDEEPNKKE